MSNKRGEEGSGKGRDKWKEMEGELEVEGFIKSKSDLIRIPPEGGRLSGVLKGC